MAQTQGGTNFVKVENLPPGLSDCRELYGHFSVVGNIQVGYAAVCTLGMAVRYIVESRQFSSLLVFQK